MGVVNDQAEVSPLSKPSKKNGFCVDAEFPPFSGPPSSLLCTSIAGICGAPLSHRILVEDPETPGLRGVEHGIGPVAPAIRIVVALTRANVDVFTRVKNDRPTVASRAVGAGSPREIGSGVDARARGGEAYRDIATDDRSNRGKEGMSP